MDRTPPQQQRGGRAASRTPPRHTLAWPIGSPVGMGAHQSARTPPTGRAHLSSARRRSAAAGLGRRQDGDVKADSEQMKSAVVAGAASIPSSLVLQISRSDIGVGLPTRAVVHQITADEGGPNAGPVPSPASAPTVGGVIAGMPGVGGAVAGVAAAGAQTRLGSSQQVNVFPSLCLSGFGSHRVDAVEYESSDDEDGLDGDLTRLPSTSFGRTKRALQLEALGLTPETVAQLYGGRSDLDESVRPSADIVKGVRSSDASVSGDSVCKQSATCFDRPESCGGDDTLPGLRAHFDAPAGLAVSRLRDGTEAVAFRGPKTDGLEVSAGRMGRSLDALSTGIAAVGFERLPPRMLQQVKRCRLE